MKKISIQKNIFTKTVPALIFCGLIYLLLPLLYSGKTVDPLLTLRSLVLIFSIVLGYMLLVLKPGTINFQGVKNYLTLTLILYTASSLCSGLFAINKAEYFYSLSRDLTNLILYLLLLLFIDSIKNTINMIIKFTMISGAVFGLLGLGQYFMGWFLNIPGHGGVYSTFANRNLFASITLLIVPFVLYCCFRFSRIWRILGVFVMIISTFNIVIIRARAVFIAVFAIVYFLILWFSFSRFRISIPDRKLLKVIILIIILTAMISYGISKTEYFTRMHPGISNKTLGGQSTIFVRIYAWEKTWEMIKEHPFSGVGAGNWKINLPKYVLEGERLETGAYQYIRPHNDYLWVWSENGLWGFIFYLLIFITAFIYGLRMLKRPGGNRLLVLLLLSGLTGYLAVAIFSFPRERIYHSVILMTYLAMLSYLYVRKNPDPDISGISHFKKFLKIISYSILIMISGLIMLYYYQRLKSEIHFYFAYNARFRNQINLTIAAIDKIDPQIFNISPTGIPVKWYRGNAYFLAGKVNKAFLDFDSAAAMHPYHIYVLNNLGSCHEIYGNHEKAISYYYKVLDISPNYCETLINLSAVYFNQREYLTALKIISKCPPNENNSKLENYRQRIQTRVNSP